MKKIHLAKFISNNGDVSPICAVTPRPLDLKKESWTINPKGVTCVRCKWLSKWKI